MRQANSSTITPSVCVSPKFFFGSLQLCVSSGLQSNPAAVSRGVSQPDRVKQEPPDLFSEEAGSTPAKSNGVQSDDDNDLFAGWETFSTNTIVWSSIHY